MDKYINKILNKLPYWFKARHDKSESDKSESTTKTFLKVFGELLYDLEQCINMAYNSTSLETFDNKDYIVRKIILNDDIDVDLVTVNKEIATRVYSSHELLNSKSVSYLLDTERNIIYISNATQIDSIYINKILYNHFEHRVWKYNILDEFGLIYSMYRLPGENNKEYKDRLLEYSRTLSNSTYHGLSNTIGHSLNKYKIIEWNNGAESISISSSDVICRHIFVDDKPYMNVKKVNDNTLSIHGDNEYNLVTRKIKYFEGFDLYELDNIDISSEEFNYIFNKISLACPIMWGVARWDQIQFLDNNIDDYYYIAPTFDPDLSKLKR